MRFFCFNILGQWRRNQENKVVSMIPMPVSRYFLTKKKILNELLSTKICLG
jgi:hypothetical protein